MTEIPPVRLAPSRPPGEEDGALVATLALWDWRRRVTELYAAVRNAEAVAGWTLWRQARDALFAGHAQSPLGEAARGRFSALPVFGYDPSLRLTVGLRPLHDAQPVPMDAGRDGAVALTPFADTVGLEPAAGAELTLYWIGGYGGGVFLPFRDGTSGTETFAGGRYLLDTIKGADLGQAPDGRLILDFNFAYNPSCAYSEDWVCPLAPPGNRLPRAIRAGERGPA